MMPHIFVVSVTVAAAVWSVESLAAPQLGCKYGSQGTCKTPPGNICPPKTFCKNGECCRRLPPNTKCKYGQNGECGGKIYDIECPTGATCQFIPDGVADGTGKCCFTEKPPLCHWGSAGVCGGKAGDVCPEGTHCKLQDMTVTDGQGLCCNLPLCWDQTEACSMANDQCPAMTRCVAPGSYGYVGDKAKCCLVRGGVVSEP